MPRLFAHVSGALTVSSDPKPALVAELEGARARTAALLAPLSDEELVAQHSPLMSPLVWDLAHIGHFEELWLVRRLTGAEPLHPETDDLYDAFAHGRAERPSLDLLDPARTREFLAEVRSRTLEVLETIALDPADRLLAGGFVYGMVVQHEHQHVETMLQTIQLSGLLHEGGGPAPCPSGGEVVLEAGSFRLGTSEEAWAYDNERPAHEVELPAFAIDTAPVTNARYLEFVEEGGYGDERLWSEAGWAHRQKEGLEHPLYWRREGDGSWSCLRFGKRETLAPDEPVQHICFFEAEAYARFAGGRLPSEAEWERAARAGVLDGVGSVHEWTSSDFAGYPGFEAFPYREYSEVFFGSRYKVLRGASWATHPTVARTTYRNWDFPVRRQIFAGLRCARDA